MRLARANYSSRSFSLVFTNRRRRLGKFDVGGGLTDQAGLRDERHLVAIDELTHELLLVDRRNHTLRIISRHVVSRHPVSVAGIGDGHRVCVAAPWSRWMPLADGWHWWTGFKASYSLISSFRFTTSMGSLPRSVTRKKQVENCHVVTHGFSNGPPHRS